MESLASSYKLNLLQDRLMSTNSIFSSSLFDSESLLYLITCVDHLIQDFISSAMTKFESAMPEL